MTTRLIKQLDDVLLAEMQREKRTGLSFREIKKVCKDAMPFLEAYNAADASGNRFIHQVLSYIANLENNGLVTVSRRGKFVLSIKLTARGIETLKNTEFIEQGPADAAAWTTDRIAQKDR